MNTKLALQVVGGRLDDLDTLRQSLAAKLGAEPSLNLRLEIGLGADRVIISVTDTDVSIRDEATGQILAQANHEVTRAAIRGLAETPPA